jgi:hypothetical protein
MRELTAAQIEKLASRAGVRRVAVENFLGTLDPASGSSGNFRNLWSDQEVYRWNASTVRAIEKGIDLAFPPAR